MLPRYFIQARLIGRSFAAWAVAVLLVVSPLLSWTLAAQQPVSTVPSSTFIVFIRGERVGSEDVAVARDANGWTITSSGRIGPPIDLVIRELRLRYTPDWKPVELKIDGAVRGQPLNIQTTVSGTAAITKVTQAGQTGDASATIAEDTVLLPSPFWAPYEALSQRLRTAQAGSKVPGHVGGAAFEIEVGESSDEAIQTASALIRARRTMARLLVPGVALDIEVWGDDAGRLLRVSVPAQNLEVAREDIASVAARRVTISRANDEAVRVPANGFSLAGTVSTPADGTTGRQLPAVILVAGSGPQDRDETVFGIPIFGQLASRLADAGFLVLRYDKRGVGQSGGRIESATLADYADDLRAALKFLSDRKDVNRRHLAVVGHSEGGSVAMMAAARDKRIAALALIATIGVSGAELNMAQVARALDRAKRPEAERQATLGLQRKIQTAVLTGKGWEEVPPALRRQADVPWFKSFLAFEPTRLMADIKQPLLIVQGLLDTQVDPSNADLLEKLARARRKAGAVEVAKVPGINHLLVPAVTGEFDEYASLKDKTVSEAVSHAVIGWLKKTFSALR